MSDSSPPAATDPLRSVYTSNLPAILDQLGIPMDIPHNQSRFGGCGLTSPLKGERNYQARLDQFTLVDAAIG